MWSDLIQVEASLSGIHTGLLTRMGLAERKNKQKISADPRNLGWSQGEFRFQRIQSRKDHNVDIEYSTTARIVSFHH